MDKINKQKNLYDLEHNRLLNVLNIFIIIIASIILSFSFKLGDLNEILNIFGISLMDTLTFITFKTTIVLALILVSIVLYLLIYTRLEDLNRNIKKLN